MSKLDRLPSNYRKSVTSQGVRVVTERMDTVRSVAFGAWMITGSRDETPELNGVSHFLEHMMFKGTEKRSALRIAREIEQVGGHLNAFTSKEMTSYYAHILDEYLPLAVDVIGDMVSNSKFLEKEIKKEQSVVLEEISSSDDTPEDVVHEDFSTAIFPDHSLGRPILGTKETVSALDSVKVKSYWKKRYTPERLVIAAAGHVDHDTLVKLVEKRFSLPGHSDPGRIMHAGPGAVLKPFTRRKKITQSHLVLGTRGLNYGDKRRFAFFLMNTVFGAGMSSRLFQRVREKNGLVYSIYSFHEAYSDVGMFGVYAGTEEKQVKRAEELIRVEIDKLINKPLSQVELKRAKAQLKGNLTLGLESSVARMNRLARMEIYLDEYMPLDDLLLLVDAVTIDDVQQVASDLLRGPLSVTYLLPE